MAQPLTRLNKKTGRPYTRPADVDAAIDRALQEDVRQVLKRAEIREPESPDYVPSECLLHLMRDARRKGDEKRMWAFAQLLLIRCEANLESTISAHGVSNPEQVRQDILQEFGLMLAEDGRGEMPDALDFFESRFNRAFRAFRIDWYRSIIREENKVAPHPEPDDGEPDAYEDAFASVSVALRSPEEQENALYLKQVAKAIDSLPPTEREAVVLCRILGYQDESEVEGEVTAATITGNKGRTIRYRLSRAAKKLASLKEDL